MQPDSRTAGWPHGRLCCLAAMLGLLAGGCTTMRESRPDRTATEELLVSTAAERAAEDMARTLPSRGTVFVDAANFDGADGRYALAAIRDAMLRHGLRVVNARAEAELIIEVRAGALSVDDSETLVGIPSIPVPVPLAEQLQLPEMALFGREMAQGVAQFSAVAYDSQTGALEVSSGPHFGFSHQTEWTVLLLFSWTTGDVRPDKPSLTELLE